MNNQKQMEGVIYMKKVIIIIGTLVVMMILISQNAIAATYYANTIEAYENVVNRTDILGSPDTDQATLGEHKIGKDFLGQIWLGFNAPVGFGPGDTVTIYVNDYWGEEEYYKVQFLVDYPPDEYPSGWYGPFSDQQDNPITVLSPTPPLPVGLSYHYVKIFATSGTTGAQDTLYGPEIDAVSFTV